MVVDEDNPKLDQQSGDSSSAESLKHEDAGKSLAAATESDGPAALSITKMATPTKKRMSGGCTTPSGSSITSVPPIMREEDADLLESMHYAASQVSQYSPGGTPVMRPKDRSLPMDDVQLSLTPMAATRGMLMKPRDGNHRREYDATDSVHQTRSDDDWESFDGGERSQNEIKSLRTDLSSSGGYVEGHMTTEKQQPTSSVRTASFTSDVKNVSSNSGSAFFKSVSFMDGDGEQHTQSSLKIPTVSLSNSSFESKPNSDDTMENNSFLRVPDLSKPSTILQDTQREIQDGIQHSIEQRPNNTRRPSFRRLLSGEVRTVNKPDDDACSQQSNDTNVGRDENDDAHKGRDTINDRRHELHTTMAGEEMIDGRPASAESESEETTTASPLSVLQEAEKANEKRESGMAHRRRVSEAIQFAQAVGEEISINRDDLRIIEDNEEDDDDDDEDEAIEAKEVVTIPGSNLHQYDDHSTTQHLQQVDLGGKTEKEADGSRVGVDPAAGDTQLPTTVDIQHAHGQHHRRHKSRPIWPFEQPAESENAFMEHLSDGADRTNFVYHGIQSNPPEITKRGLQRGNYAQLHRKAWLEVSDKYHRYGKNLRLYYRYWERLGFPTNQFFDWLDSKGEAAGQALPILEECPRSVLDSDTVLYITNPNVTDGYALDIGISKEDGRGRVEDVDGDAVLTGPDGWIFVLRDNIIYGAPKITSISGHSKQRFHHSSFFGGKAVASAGIIITDEEGYLTRLYPHSGHYRPSESHMQRMLLFLHRKGVDLHTFEVDTQQLSHLSREKDTKSKEKKASKDGKKDDRAGSTSNNKKEKTKKVDSLHLEKAIDVACYLAHKADFIGKGIFNMIHQIRKADVTTVTEALNLVDDGGYWMHLRKQRQEN